MSKPTIVDGIDACLVGLDTLAQGGSMAAVKTGAGVTALATLAELPRSMRPVIRLACIEELTARGWQAEAVDDYWRALVPDAGERPALRFRRASEIEQPKPIPWAAAGLIPSGELAMVAGDGEVFKTSVLIVIATCIPAGQPLFHRPTWITAAGDVLIVTAEDVGPLLRNRIEAVARGHGIDPATALHRIHILDVVGADFSIDAPENQQLILNKIRETQPAAVMFDPHADLTSTPENDNDAAKGPVKFYRACTVTGAAVMVAHHAGKGGKGNEVKRKIDRIRGATRLVQAARAILFLERSDLGVSVEAVKFNRGPRPAPFVLEYEIESDSTAPGMWRSASFRYLTQTAAVQQTADQFVVGQLKRNGRLNTTELKEAAKGVDGVSAADVSAALKRLSEMGWIDHVPGAHGAKLWGLIGTRQVARQGDEPDLLAGNLSGPDSILPGKVGQPGQAPGAAARGCLPPLGGQPGSTGGGQGDGEDWEDEFMQMQSRKGTDS